MAGSRVIIENVTVVNEGQRFRASVLVENGRIAEIARETELPVHDGDELVDGSDCLLLPGIIDEHVHMRDPGLTPRLPRSSS